MTATIILAVGFTAANFLQTVGKWSVLVFAFMAAHNQLGIAAHLLQILFTGLVAMAAIAGGLAFGLGGRDQASRLLTRLTGDAEKDNRDYSAP